MTHDERFRRVLKRYLREHCSHFVLHTQFPRAALLSRGDVLSIYRRLGLAA